MGGRCWGTASPTGFGEFKNVPIAPYSLEELQRNILLSHSVGLGETADAGNPANYFESDVVRATLTIRLTAFLKAIPASASRWCAR